MERQDLITNSIGIFISIVGAIVGLIYSRKADSMIGILVMLGMFLLIIIFFLISWRMDISAKRDKKIRENSRKIILLQKGLNSFKNRINLIKDVADLKSRMLDLEKMKINKRGVIDPRIVVIILIVILIYIFLREQGVI